MRKNNRGFTLVELLATIAVLGLVVSITVFTGIRLIKNGKEKTYQTTKNNIEKYAGNYLIENSDRLFYLSKNNLDGDINVEYQCVTLQNLIDTGYFDTKLLESNVAEGVTPSKSDYVYIERDINTKTVMKNVYIQSTDKESKKTCDSAVKAEMDIAFIPSGNNGRTRMLFYKTVDITIIYKLKNANNINDYDYKYNYSNDKIELLEDNGNEKKVRVSDNGTLTGIINYLGESAYEDDFIVDAIDNDGPIITLGDYDKGYVKGSVDINIKVMDEKTEVDPDSFTVDDIRVTVGGKEIDTSNLTLVEDKHNDYKLTIKNDKLEGPVVISIDSGKVLDELGNGNEAVVFNPEVTFDNTPPIITFSNDGNSKYEKSVSSMITVTDSGSSGDSTTYKYKYSTNSKDTPNTSFESGKVYKLSTGTGSYYLIVRACDKVGNCSNKISKEFKLDNEGPKYVSGGNVTNGSVEQALFEDKHSGLKEVYYLAKDKDSEPKGDDFSNTERTFSTECGKTYYIYAKAVDNLGNYTIKKLGSYKGESCCVVTEWYNSGSCSWDGWQTQIRDEGCGDITSQKIACTSYEQRSDYSSCQGGWKTRTACTYTGGVANCWSESSKCDACLSAGGYYGKNGECCFGRGKYRWECTY